MYIVSWEPEGHYLYSKIFCWEPEGSYRYRRHTAIVPFWFSTEHFGIVIAPFWFSTEHLGILIAPFWLSTNDIYGIQCYSCSVVNKIECTQTHPYTHSQNCNVSMWGPINFFLSKWGHVCSLNTNHNFDPLTGESPNPLYTEFVLTHSIQDSETSIDFVQGPAGSRGERVKLTMWGQVVK